MEQVKYRIYLKSGERLLLVWSYTAEGNFRRRINGIAKLPFLRDYFVTVRDDLDGSLEWFEVKFLGKNFWELKQTDASEIKRLYFSTKTAEDDSAKLGTTEGIT